MPALRGNASNLPRAPPDGPAISPKRRGLSLHSFLLLPSPCILMTLVSPGVCLCKLPSCCWLASFAEQEASASWQCLIGDDPRCQVDAGAAAPGNRLGPPVSRVIYIFTITASTWQSTPELVSSVIACWPCWRGEVLLIFGNIVIWTPDGVWRCLCVPAQGVGGDTDTLFWTKWVACMQPAPQHHIYTTPTPI